MLVSDVAVTNVTGSTSLLCACSICLALLFGITVWHRCSQHHHKGCMESQDMRLCYESPEMMPYATSQNKLKIMCRLHVMWCDVMRCGVV